MKLRCRWGIIVCLSVSGFGIAALVFQTQTFNYFSFPFWSSESPKNGVAASGLRTPNSSILVLYWTTVFGHTVNVTGSDKRFNWPFFAADEHCPVKCELTTNKSRIGEASALVVHGRDTHEMPKSSQFNTIPWIFHVNESPVYTFAIRDESVMARFNYLVSYRLDFEFPCPEFHKPKLTRPVPFQLKTGLSVAVYSHCEDVRTLYLFRLMKHMQIDSYGKCLQNKPRLPRKVNNFEFLQGIMAKYKFTFVIPKSDCDYYITEKIYNALSAGSVPVWMGTDKIEEFIKWGNLKNSVIKVRDFQSPKQLAKYLLWLSQNETEYNKILKWKYEGFNFPMEYYKSKIGEWWDGMPLYCQVCMKLARDPQHRSALNVDLCDGRQRRTLEKWIRE